MSEYLKRAEWITWIDTIGVGGWKDFADAQQREPTVINTMGFVIAETREKLSIGQSIDATNEQVDHMMVIPKRCILDRWTVR